MSGVDPGGVHHEAEVTEVLQRFRPDHAALRHHPADEQFTTRHAGHDWRSGGTVVV